MKEDLRNARRVRSSESIPVQAEQADLERVRHREIHSLSAYEHRLRGREQGRGNACQVDACAPGAAPRRGGPAGGGGPIAWLRLPARFQHAANLEHHKRSLKIAGLE